jgi:hypothetical protein
MDVRQVIDVTLGTNININCHQCVIGSLLVTDFKKVRWVDQKVIPRPSVTTL